MNCQNTASITEEVEQAMVEVQPKELEEDAVGFFKGEPLPKQVVKDGEKLQTAMGFDSKLVAMFKILDRNNNNSIEASELFASMKDVRLALGLEHPKSITEIMGVFAF